MTLYVNSVQWSFSKLHQLVRTTEEVHNHRHVMHYLLSHNTADSHFWCHSHFWCASSLTIISDMIIILNLVTKPPYQGILEDQVVNFKWSSLFFNQAQLRSQTILNPKCRRGVWSVNVTLYGGNQTSIFIPSESVMRFQMVNLGSKKPLPNFPWNLIKNWAGHLRYF